MSTRTPATPRGGPGNRPATAHERRTEEELLRLVDRHPGREPRFYHRHLPRPLPAGWTEWDTAACLLGKAVPHVGEEATLDTDLDGSHFWTRGQGPVSEEATVTCEKCGRSFTPRPRSREARYCSARCRVAAHRSRTVTQSAPPAAEQEAVT